MGWTPDYDDHLPKSGTAALSKLLSLRPSRTRPISTGLRMRIPCETTQKWYYLRGEEDKDCEFGRLWIMVAAPLANVTAGTNTSLIVRIRWKIEFQMPDMPTSAGPEGEAIYPQYRDSKIFTTSSSDWRDGKYLTFKYTSGGQIVGFPNAQKGVIYLVQKGAGLNYVKSDKTYGSISCATPSGDAAEEGYLLMAAFDTPQNAKEYIDSKYSDSKLLRYYGAGEYSEFPDVAFYPIGELDAVVVSRHKQNSRQRLPEAAVAPGRYLVADSTTHKYAELARATYNRLMKDPQARPERGILKQAMENLKNLSVVDYTLGAEEFTALRTAPFDWEPPVIASTSQNGPPTESETKPGYPGLEIDVLQKILEKLTHVETRLSKLEGSEVSSQPEVLDPSELDPENAVL